VDVYLFILIINDSFRLFELTSKYCAMCLNLQLPLRRVVFLCI